MLAVGLAGAFFLTVAFIGLRNEAKMKNLQQPVAGNGFAVVELFTSEGCSSCPPADKLLKTIEQDNQNKEIYILAFHVDYWDHLGWKDRFSDPAFSDRQARYAGWIKPGTIYTPQLIVNGTKQFVGSDRGAILDAITNSLDKTPLDTLLLKAIIAGDELQVEYKAGIGVKNSELVLALVQKEANSSVKAGENSGRNLSHVQIVRRMKLIPLAEKSLKATTMKLPADFTQKGWELIGFVQRKTDGQVSAAARLRFDL